MLDEHQRERRVSVERAHVQLLAAAGVGGGGVGAQADEPLGEVGKGRSEKVREGQRRAEKVREGQRRSEKDREGQGRSEKVRECQRRREAAGDRT